jgi:ribonuclease P protein component
LTTQTSPGVRRIRHRAGFDELRRRGRRRRVGSLQVVYAAGPAASAPCVAYAVGRAVGTAVVRNRVRRRLRAIAAELAAAGRLAPGAYLVVAGPEAATAPFATLREWMDAACGDLGRSAA